MPSNQTLSCHPLFRQLALERACLGLSMAGIIAVAYFSFILLVAFDPAYLGTPIHEGSVISLGVVAGVGLLCFGFVLTVFYVIVSNLRLDPINDRLHKEVK